MQLTKRGLLNSNVNFRWLSVINFYTTKQIDKIYSIRELPTSVTTVEISNSMYRNMTNNTVLIYRSRLREKCTHRFHFRFVSVVQIHEFYLSRSPLETKIVAVNRNLTNIFVLKTRI